MFCRGKSCRRITNVRCEPSCGGWIVHIAVFWVSAPCIVVGLCWRFRGACRLCFQCRRKWVPVDTEVIPVRMGFDCEADCKECDQSDQREVYRWVAFNNQSTFWPWTLRRQLGASFFNLLDGGSMCAETSVSSWNTRRCKSPEDCCLNILINVWKKGKCSNLCDVTLAV